MRHLNILILSFMIRNPIHFIILEILKNLDLHFTNFIYFSFKLLYFISFNYHLIQKSQFIIY